MASESKNNNLHQAKEAKNDEFYTQLSDIQAELSHYTDKFQGKVVFCNCDDPFESNFVKYFLMNFNRLGLKELISTGYKTSQVGGVEIGTANTPYVLRIKDTSKYLVGTQKDLDIRGAKYFLETEGNKVMTPLIGNAALDENGEPIKVTIKVPVMDENGNPVLLKSGKPKMTTQEKDLFYEAGDFRSNMSLALLDESDIVCTNPPFSLFREFIDILINHNKKFLVLGNMNAITYKEFFPLLKENQVWLGNKCCGGGMNMIYPKNQFDANKVKKYTIDSRGNYIVNIMGVIWFTNIDHPKRHQMLPLDLGFTYYGHEDMYPQYDNYNAINVNKVSEIPCDYEPCWYKCLQAANCQYALTKGGDENNALCEMIQPCEDVDRQTDRQTDRWHRKCNGIIGVPISFLDKYCPEQFEIINGIGRYACIEADYTNPIGTYGTDINGEHTYFRVLIKFTDDYINAHPEQFKKDGDN